MCPADMLSADRRHVRRLLPEVLPSGVAHLLAPLA